MDNKQKAQQRADQVQAFYDEITQLEVDKVLQLDQNQRQSIAHYHEGLLKSLTEKFDIDTSTRLINKTPIVYPKAYSMMVKSRSILRQEIVQNWT